MKSNKVLIEKIYVSEVTESEKEQLIADGYNYVGGDDYTFELIYEKEIKTEQKSCWNCMQRIGEECGITGQEVYHDTEACSSHEES